MIDTRYLKNLPKRIWFVKTNGKEAFVNVAVGGYCRGPDTLVVCAGYESWPGILLHEWFHLFERHNSVLVESMIRSMGYTKAHKIDIEPIRDFWVTNPDELPLQWVYDSASEEKYPYMIPGLVTTSATAKGFEHISSQPVLAERKGSVIRAVVGPTGGPMFAKAGLEPHGMMHVRYAHGEPNEYLAYTFERLALVPGALAKHPILGSLVAGIPLRRSTRSWYSATTRDYTINDEESKEEKKITKERSSIRAARRAATKKSCRDRTSTWLRKFSGHTLRFYQHPTLGLLVKIDQSASDGPLQWYTADGKLLASRPNYWRPGPVPAHIQALIDEWNRVRSFIEEQAEYMGDC